MSLFSKAVKHQANIEKIWESGILIQLPVTSLQQYYIPIIWHFVCYKCLFLLAARQYQTQFGVKQVDRKSMTEKIGNGIVVLIVLLFYLITDDIEYFSCIN